LFPLEIKRKIMSTAAGCFKSTHPLHVLRGLLRNVGKLPSFKAGEAVLSKPDTSSEVGAAMSPKSYLMSQYRTSRTLEPKSLEAAQQRRLAYDYWQLVSKVKERGALHELDGGAETKLTPKEFTRRAAARVGFSMPDEL
jgi:hypothetical protein